MPLLPNSAAADPAAEPQAGSVVASPLGSRPGERRHFVFGLFDVFPKAEHALRKLRVARFEDSHVLLVGAAVANADGSAILWEQLPAGAPFGSLANVIRRPEAATSRPQDGLAPRITDQIVTYLDRGGAVLIVAVQTAEQERVAARTLLNSKCDVLLTHEVAVRA